MRRPAAPATALESRSGVAHPIESGPIRREAAVRTSRAWAPPAAATLPLALVAVVIAWWGWKSGAYFRPTFLPGSIVLVLLLAALLAYAPCPGRIGGGFRLALFALTGLAAWTALSALWSPAPDIALGDATRVAVYALALLLGFWLCLLLGRRMLLALAPLAAAAAAVGLLTLVALATSEDATRLLDQEGTLRYPLGYRNAAAAFFLIGVLSTLVLAAARELDWRLRGGLLASATLLLELAVLTQSRAAVFALAIGLAALFAAHPARLRILAWTALAAVPLAPAMPWLLEVFQQGGLDTKESLPSLRDAAAAIAVTTVAAGVIGTLAARADPRIVLSEQTGRRLGAGLIALLGIVTLGGSVAIAVSEGGPAGFLSRHADELTAGSPDLSEQGTRFGLDLRSNRGDLWRVAWDDFREDPITGGGGGGFRFSYLLDRESHLQPEDPHSIEMLIASELGLPGLALFFTFVGGTLVAVVRARRLGPSAAALAGGAIAIGAYWLTQASVEWFWSYPALCVPVAFAVGAAAAPGRLDPAGGIPIATRRVLASVLLLGALAVLPAFFSERYTADALRNWETDLDGAYSSLGRAADLNPLSDRPLAAEAVIAEAAGEPQRALGALAEAQERTPREWTLYYLEARIEAASDPAAARRALSRAEELNPGATELEDLRDSLGASAP